MFSRRGLNELVADGMIGHDTATRLAAALRASGDVLICGPAGSGKTMLLRALLDESGQPGQRIAWIGPGAASGCPDTLALSDGAGLGLGPFARTQRAPHGRDPDRG